MNLYISDIADDKSEIEKLPVQQGGSSKRQTRSGGKKSPTDEEKSVSETLQRDSDMLRMFAEVHFINGEVMFLAL